MKIIAIEEHWNSVNIRDALDRYPDLQLVLGHWGEMLLSWMDRADSLSGIAKRSLHDITRPRRRAGVRIFPDPSGRYLLAGINGKLGWISGGRLIPLQAEPQLSWIAW